MGSFLLTAQIKKMPLKDLLPKIEALHKVSFSYADSYIKDVLVSFDYKLLSLEETLVILSNKTQLEFKQLNNTFITIRNATAQAHFKFEELEEVIITNYLTSGISKNVTGSITIKPNEFSILPGLIAPDVLQAVQALPGIISVDETVSNINIRGGTHDQNLILYDGIRMYQSGHFFGLISAFNPYLAKDIAVLKNGTNAQYGGSVSGVIDIQLDDDISQQKSYGFGLDLISIDGFTILPIGAQTTLQIAARRSLTDIANTPTYTQYFKRVFQDSDFTNTNESTITKNEDFYFYDTSIKILHDFSKNNKLRLNFISIGNTLNYQEASTVNTMEEDFESQLQQRSLGTRLSYEHQFNDQTSATAQLHYSSYKIDATNNDLLNEQRLIQQNEVIDDGFHLDIRHVISPNITLSSGFDFSEIGITNFEDVNNPEFRSFIKNVLHTYAMYSEFMFSSGDDDMVLTMGLRSHYFEKFERYTFEPRLHYSQRFLKAFRVELSGELKSRWILANNSTIPIMTSKQTTLGLQYNKHKVLISLEGYLKEVNGITTRSQGFQNQFQFVNATGSYFSKGIDILISKQFHNFTSWLSY